MLVDGKLIASDILSELAEKVSKLEKKPRMVAVTCAPNFETRKYLEMKITKAKSVGIELSVVELPEDSTTQMVIDSVHKICEESDGVVVQLPLPEQVDKDMVLAAIPVNKDPDGFKYGINEEACLSPVVAAIDAISKKYEVDWKDQKVVILGEGRLVGKPAREYAEKNEADVSVLTEDNFSEEVLESADIVVTGIGKPHFIKEQKLKKDVVIFDAGTSEDGGELVGDVHPSVSENASLFTPVPGGVGPITIACLLNNLVEIRESK